MQVLRGRGLWHRADAFARPPDDEEAAYAIALSARRFTRRTQRLVDDKLSFSATLMRAGEVAEATRAMAEFEHEVSGEKAALMERVCEAGLQTRRRRRPPLGRLLSPVLMGMSLMCVSLVGAALAGLVVDRFSPSVREGRRDRVVAAAVAAPDVRVVRVAPGVKVELDRRQFQTYRMLLSGSPVDRTTLAAFFEGLPPDVAAAVRRALNATGVLSNETSEVVDLLFDAARIDQKDARRHPSEPAARSGDDAANEPAGADDSDESPSASDGKAGNQKPSGDDDGTKASLPGPSLPVPLPLP